MFRVAYMNHGDHESLVRVTSWSTSGPITEAVRWFELRRQGSGRAGSSTRRGPTPSTATSRWMAAVGDGPVRATSRMGYNVTSSSTFPSLRYTGRSWAPSALNQMC